MAKIPVANKHKDTAVAQHLVPQCYMREWSYNPKQTSVWLYEKNHSAIDANIDEVSALCTSKRLKKINAIDNYYDIKAGCYFMPQEALDEIFGPTMHLIVSLNGELLDTEKKRNNKFGLFDEWMITDNSHTPLTDEERNELKQYFSDARFVFIEKEWRQYENNWRNYIKDLEDKIRKTKAGTLVDKKSGMSVSKIITTDIISEIVKLLIIFDIRGFSSNEYLNEQIDKVFDRCWLTELYEMELEPEGRMHPIETTVKESFKHQFILHICYDILKDNNVTGVAKDFWEGYIKHLVPRFCLTDKSHPFVTSEHPAFINERDDGKKEHIFVALPTMLISMGRGDKGQFFINNLTKEEVYNYNKIIVQNNESIISCTKTLNIGNV